MPTQEARAIWTTAEAATYLKVDERSITAWAKRGIIPGKKLGSLWRFYRDELENLPTQQVESKA